MSARILVVDDDRDICRMVGLVLRGRGYEVIEANEGDEALRLAADAPPDLAVVDLLMPRMNGFALCRALREFTPERPIPVIMLTCLDEVEQRVQGFEAGADDYVCKPFSADELAARVAAVLRRTYGRQEAEGATQGSLSDLPLSDLMQLMAAGRKTGTLYLRRGELEGVLSLVEGRPVVATLGEKAGPEAVFALLQWEDGRFRYDSTPLDAPPNLPAKATCEELLLGAARWADETSRLSPTETSAELERPETPPGHPSGAADLATPVSREDELAACLDTLAQKIPPSSPGLRERAIRLVIAGHASAGRQELFDGVIELLQPFARPGPPAPGRSDGPMPWDRIILRNGLTIYVYGVGTEPGQAYLWNIALENVAGCILLADGREVERLKSVQPFCHAASRSPDAVIALLVAINSGQKVAPAEMIIGALGLPSGTPVHFCPANDPTNAKTGLQMWVNALPESLGP